MGEILLDVNNYLICRDTPWDTTVLGYKTNEIQEFVYSDERQLHKLLVKFEELCKSQKYLFTNTRINPDDQVLRKVLTGQGYINTETSFLVERGTSNLDAYEKICNLKFSLRKYKTDDLEELKSIAFEIFNYGRFFEDPYISNENARIRNKNWIGDLVTTSTIMIGELNTTLFGFMAIRVEGTTASLQLGGVKSNFSIYSYPFWYKIFSELISKYGVKHFSGIVSAGNTRILNLYSYFGFKFSKAWFGYHKHRNLV